MLTIRLHNLPFTALHGLFEEEQLAGNTFIVNVTIEYHPVKWVITRLEETIDYGSVYALVKEQMATHVPLLETWAMQAAHTILQKYSQAERVEVCIKKSHPPIMHFEGSIEICYTAGKIEEKE